MKFIYPCDHAPLPPIIEMQNSDGSRVFLTKCLPNQTQAPLGDISYYYPDSSRKHGIHREYPSLYT
jgi:hypothetical protein